MASSNIKLFDENKGNMLTDTEFNISAQRLNGLQTGVASSQLQNKAMYQASLVAYAIAQVMMQNGLNANDTDAVSTFVANLSGTMLQKVYDIATTEEAKAGVATGKWMSPALVKAAIDKTLSDNDFLKKSGDTMTGDLYFPDGKKLWFYTSGTVGYYLKKDSNSLGVYDQDGHLLLGFNYNGKPVAFGGNRIVTADEMVGVPKIAIGSYVGTGTYSSANPNSLTFDFEPKVVIIVQNSYDNFPGTVFIRGQTLSGTIGENYISNSQLTVGWSGNTVTWYTNSSSYKDRAQLNISGNTYFYIALG